MKLYGNQFRDKKRRLAPLIKARDDGRELLVQHYATSLLDFARDVVCVNEPKNLISEDVHGPMCRMLQDLYWGLAEKKVPDDSIHGALINVPRGCFKSTIATIAFPLWVMLQNRPDEDVYQPPTSFNGKKGCDQRINLAHETDPESQKYLGAIAYHLHKNSFLRSLYGEDVFWRKKTEGRWSSWELDVPWRTDYTAREANLTTTSLRSSIAGGHYDITVWDDIFTEKTIGEENGIRRVMDYYQKYIPVAHLPSLLIVVGTRKHDADLYGYIQEKEGDKWHVMVEKAWRDPDDIADGKREFFFPQKHNREVLLDIKERMGNEYFFSEFQNMPLDPKTAPFRADWFADATFDLPIDPEKRKKFLSDKTVYVLSDPAIADHSKACLSTIGAIGVDPNGHFWLLDVWGEKGVGDDPMKYIDELYSQSDEFDAMWTCVETVGFSKMIRWAGDQRGKETGKYLNWFELKPANRSKEARILGLRPLARQGGIHLQAHHQHVLQEFLRYPKGKSRDFIDMIAYTMDVATTPSGDSNPAEEKSQRPYTKENMALQRMANRGIVFPNSNLENFDDDRFDCY